MKLHWGRSATYRAYPLRGVIEAQFDFSNFFELQTLLLTTLRPLAKEENSELVSTFERFRISHFILEALILVTISSPGHKDPQKWDLSVGLIISSHKMHAKIMKLIFLNIVRKKILTKNTLFHCQFVCSTSICFWCYNIM